MRSATRMIPAPVLAIALLLPPAALGTDTHAEYVAQVNPICKSAERQAARNEKRIKPSGDPRTDFLRRVQAFGRLLGKTTKRIAAVDPAPGEEAAVRRWIAGLRQQKRLIDRYLRAGIRGDAMQAMALAERTARVEKRNRKQARRLGLTACG
jgi:hypothetical protein